MGGGRGDGDGGKGEEEGSSCKVGLAGEEEGEFFFVVDMLGVHVFSPFLFLGERKRRRERGSVNGLGEQWGGGNNGGWGGVQLMGGLVNFWLKIDFYMSHKVTK